MILCMNTGACIRVRNSLIGRGGLDASRVFSKWVGSMHPNARSATQEIGFLPRITARTL